MTETQKHMNELRDLMANIVNEYKIAHDGGGKYILETKYASIEYRLEIGQFWTNFFVVYNGEAIARNNYRTEELYNFTASGDRITFWGADLDLLGIIEGVVRR